MAAKFYANFSLVNDSVDELLTEVQVINVLTQVE